MPDYDVVLKMIAPMFIAARRVTIPTNAEVPVYLDAAFGAVFSFVKRGGLKTLGPPFAVWHQAAEIHTNEIAEAAVAVDRTLSGEDGVVVYEMPAAQVVAVVHHGAFENFRGEHLALLSWIEANDYQIAGPYREMYINHDPRHMAEAATEIQYPVVKNRASA